MRNFNFLPIIFFFFEDSDWREIRNLGQSLFEKFYYSSKIRRARSTRWRVPERMSVDRVPAGEQRRGCAFDGVRKIRSNQKSQKSNFLYSKLTFFFLFFLEEAKVFKFAWLSGVQRPWHFVRSSDFRTRRIKPIFSSLFLQPRTIVLRAFTRMFRRPALPPASGNLSFDEPPTCPTNPKVPIIFPWKNKAPERPHERSVNSTGNE